jgi:hypothetical protein
MAVFNRILFSRLILRLFSDLKRKFITQIYIEVYAQKLLTDAKVMFLRYKEAI